MNIVREKGIDGIQVYFGADEKRLNEFLTRNNLNEVARNEAKVRMEGGDWLKATRDALASNTNNVSANINEGLKNAFVIIKNIRYYGNTAGSGNSACR